MNIKKSVPELIGHTPLLELTNYEANHQLHADVYKSQILEACCGALTK